MEKIVVPELTGKRVDQVVSIIMGISRSKAAALCGKSLVKVNGIPVVKSQIINSGDCILIDIFEESGVLLKTPADLPLLYQDEDLFVINKPVGMAAHPAVGWKGPTVVGALLAQGYTLDTSGDLERRGIVHRLDVGTTGLMVVARNENSYQILKSQFANREVEKIYHTVVQGYLPYENGIIDAPLGRHPKASFKMAVVSKGRNALTHYRVLRKLREASLLEVRLETGRTHQIRVHMQALKHPVLGDPIYGSNPKKAAELGLERQWLHAIKLGFKHPRNGEKVSFTTPYPQDLEDSLQQLEIS